MAGQDWIERGKNRLMRVWDKDDFIAAVGARLKKKEE